MNSRDELFDDDLTLVLLDDDIQDLQRELMKPLLPLLEWCVKNLTRILK